MVATVVAFLALSGSHGLLALAAVCPGNVRLPGADGGQVAVIPTGWPSGGATTEVHDNRMVVPHMGARVYFATQCTAGVYDHKQYLALNFLGKTLKYTTDMSGSGCGCNAALYLVSMRQNANPSNCRDYYCDANNVCGVSCPEIDIQEANEYAWHSTLHSSQDHNGVGAGYGGGSGWNGPRDFNHDQYGPGAGCIDTARPFQVAASFPTDVQGKLMGMEVTLTQEGKSCPLTMKINSYGGMAELSQALSAGMTPVISYWSNNNMLWLDGKGADWKGPCASDNAGACTESVKFYDFSVTEIDGGAPGPAPAAPGPERNDMCPGAFRLAGHGDVTLVGATWNVPQQPAGRVEVEGNGVIRSGMKGRAYFADVCVPGKYNRADYLALKLLGKTLSYTTDMSGAGCGCNAALYLVSMQQNTNPSGCEDYYCDANNVCGVSCAEVDIQEANEHAWHSTLHSPQDHGGVGVGYGGGSSWNGPRDFGAGEYGPNAKCIDTSRPFQVSVSFPTGADGMLQAMQVVLTQQDKDCPLRVRIDSYSGMQQVSDALANGMTPVISYWSADDMTWMDGRGADGRGPCTADHADQCADFVRFYNFSLVDIAATQPAPQPPAPSPSAAAGMCPGEFDVPGHGRVSLVPTGWHQSASPVEVRGGRVLVPHMGGRAYFSDTCTAGTYNNTQYLALNLLGKTLSYTTDMAGSGCGCNAALYLVSMRQNTNPSSCNDYYCDANEVCGVWCSEIDIQEANQLSWHSTLHSSHDRSGKGAGFGGGLGWNGPRDFESSQYGPGATCIDTTKPFRVSASFPVDALGKLRAMEVTLSQAGSDCPLTMHVEGYGGMAEVGEALKAGMTPVMSYWSANDMLWMDGKGNDGRGPCAKDDAAACPETVRFFDFAVYDIGGVPPTAAPTMAPTTPSTTPLTTSTATPTTSAASPFLPPAEEDDAEVVEVTVAVRASDVPPSWREGEEVLLGAGAGGFRGGIVRITSGSATPPATPAGDVAEPAATQPSWVVPVEGMSAVALVAVILVAACSIRTWARHIPAELVEAAKARIDPTGVSRHRASTLSLNLAGEGQSPLRRRRGPEGSGETPLRQDMTPSHPRFPTVDGASEHDSRPLSTAGLR